MNITISQQYAIGIDIGGTNTKFGLVNHRGDVSYHGSIPTDKHEDINDFINDLYLALSPAIAEVGGNDYIRGIGIGAPNGNIYKGTIEYAPNLRWKGVIPVAELFSKRFGLTARLTNDANAAAA